MWGSYHPLNTTGGNGWLIGVFSEVTTHTKTGNPLQKTTTKEDLLSEVTHHILFNQITALNCYIELLIEVSRETDRQAST